MVATNRFVPVAAGIERLADRPKKREKGECGEAPTFVRFKKTIELKAQAYG